jgi:hypothetical protein
MTNDNVWINSIKENREILAMLIRHEIDMTNELTNRDLKSALVKLQQDNNYVSADEATEIITLLLVAISGKYPSLYPVEFVKEIGGRYIK